MPSSISSWALLSDDREESIDRAPVCTGTMPSHTVGTSSGTPSPSEQNTRFQQDRRNSGTVLIPRCGTKVVIVTSRHGFLFTLPQLTRKIFGSGVIPTMRRCAGWIKRHQQRCNRKRTTLIPKPCLDHPRCNLLPIMWNRRSVLRFCLIRNQTQVCLWASLALSLRFLFQFCRPTE